LRLVNKFERAKQEKDGLDVFPALMRAAEVGWESLDDDDLMRLKWYGLYAHNAKDGHFMLRTKVVQGVLSADQAEVMAGITDDFARGIIDCTTRQCFQNHWITLDERPGDLRAPGRGRADHQARAATSPRNVVGCTLRHRPRGSSSTAYATAEAIHEHFLDNKLYSNLPRKYKISVTGCTEDCARGLINDIALLRRRSTRTAPPGFNSRVGGGLSSRPRFARWIDVFVRPRRPPRCRRASPRSSATRRRTGRRAARRA
jgi:sulfite reductase beta subunit-like hemoprotein